ncbi:integrase core domain-containing protein [Agrobacterium vitis]|nr:integrase core domain-containing protein [Agrobacterium vitis]WEO71979.1 integrase core domain-containing protein [Agrobacterium vitis]
MGVEAKHQHRPFQPGKPQQNAYIERYNRTVRHEWLGCFMFVPSRMVQDHATRWIWTCNNDRPNMAIGGMTPRQKLKMAAQILLMSPVKKGGITMRQAR